jgi:hypothetical protein
MLFGQSVFQSVLTRLKEEETDEEDADATGGDFRIRGLGAGFVAPTKEHGTATTEAGIDAYFAYLPDEPAEPPEETAPATADAGEQPVGEVPVPAHLLRLTEAEIAEELAISPQDSEAALGERRRQFAKANHPDLVAPQFRDNATIRMTIANQLIDRAIKDLFWR